MKWLSSVIAVPSAWSCNHGNRGGRRGWQSEMKKFSELLLDFTGEEISENLRAETKLQLHSERSSVFIFSGLCLLKLGWPLTPAVSTLGLSLTLTRPVMNSKAAYTRCGTSPSPGPRRWTRAGLRWTSCGPEGSGRWRWSGPWCQRPGWPMWAGCRWGNL